MKDATFDLVTCSWTLTHVPDLLAALESFARVLRPEGLAVISEITRSRS